MDLATSKLDRDTSAWGSDWNIVLADKVPSCPARTGKFLTLFLCQQAVH